MIWGIFPHQAGVSFETHLWGAALGALCALFFRKYDPTPSLKHYAWENEDEETEDPFIGDAWNKIDDNQEENEKPE